MITTQAYKNQFTGEQFASPGDCLRSEFWHFPVRVRMPAAVRFTRKQWAQAPACE